MSVANSQRPDRGDHSIESRLGDFSADWRVLILVAMALVVGAGGAGSAWLLVKLIALATNLAWFGHFSFASAAPANAAMGPWMVAVPAVGGLVIGLMARFGSEKIRGHGIPEAIEAILIGGSRMDPKVAVLKPLSSAISIGTGGPFGAEGPIIMTGGAIGYMRARRSSFARPKRTFSGEVAYSLLDRNLAQKAFDFFPQIRSCRFGGL
jgi:H+/Cl- antiporter ClcA